jgi:hypothetical protein
MSQPTPPLEYNPYAPSTPEATALAAPVIDDSSDLLREQIRALFERGKNGAAWFYWVAGLSAINTAIALAGNDWGFALGLGVTTIANAIALQGVPPEHRSTAIGVAVVFNVIVLGCVVLCGWLAQKRFLVPFALGMFLYLLDGLLYLLLGNVMSILLHGFALFCMWNGFSAYRQLNALERQLASGTITGPQPVGGP